MVVEILEQIETSDRILQPGQLADIPDEVVRQLGGKVRPLRPLRKGLDAQCATHLQKQSSDFAEVITLSPADLEAQQKSTDWRQFCDNHENDLPDSYCTLKRDKCRDPFTNCVGYQLKNGRVIH
jgi:hypothetical protein